MHQPKALIFVCGADALSNDPLGNFNLSIQAYEQCAYVMLYLARNFNVPLLVLGGGGYHETNAARCFASVTGVLVLNYSLVLRKNNARVSVLPKEIPEHVFYEQYAPSFERHVPKCLGMKNQNSEEELQALKNQLFS